MSNEESDIACVKDAGKWNAGTCRMCGSPTLWRHKNLQAVARTGDEAIASVETRHIGTELLNAYKAFVDEHICLAITTNEAAAREEADGITIDGNAVALTPRAMAALMSLLGLIDDIRFPNGGMIDETRAQAKEQA